MLMKRCRLISIELYALSLPTLTFLFRKVVCHMELSVLFPGMDKLAPWQKSMLLQTGFDRNYNRALAQQRRAPHSPMIASSEVAGHEYDLFMGKPYVSAHT